MVVKLSHIQKIKLRSQIDIKSKQLELYMVLKQKRKPQLRNMTEAT